MSAKVIGKNIEVLFWLTVYICREATLSTAVAAAADTDFN